MRGSYKDIIWIALPVIFGSIAQTSISVADTAMLGRIGTIEVAAIGYVSVYYLTLFMIGFSYTKGTQIMVARRIGEGDDAACGTIFDNSLLAVLLQGIGLFLVLRFTSHFFLSHLVADEAIRAAGIEYLELRSWGIIFSFIGSVFLAFYLATERMVILLVAVISMAVINIFLNWVMIFGNLGFPAMGIRGAAIASNIAEAIAAVIFIGYVFTHKLYKKYSMFRVSNFSRSVVQNITNISFPIVAQTLIGLMGWMFFFYYIEKMGPEPTAVSSIVKNIYMFFGLFAWGFSASSNTIISNLMGQQKQRLVIPAIKKIIILSVGVGVLFSVPLWIFAADIIDAVYSPTPEVLAASVPVVYVAIIALLVYSVSMVLYHSITSTGSVKASLTIEIITILIYVLYIQIVFSLDNPSLPLVWTCEIFYWLLLAGLTILYLRTDHWKKVKI